MSPAAHLQCRTRLHFNAFVRLFSQNNSHALEPLTFFLSVLATMATTTAIAVAVANEINKNKSKKTTKKIK